MRFFFFSTPQSAIYNRNSMEQARIVELLAPFLGLTEDLSSGTHQDLASRISTYIDILLRWNARINLTAIRDPEEIVTRHFGESLFAARHLFPDMNCVGTAVPGCPTEQSSAAGATEAASQRIDHREGGRAPLRRREKDSPEIGASTPTTLQSTLADIGSGAGFPGIPIKLWAPDVSLTLIESSYKKAAFLHEINRSLILTDINIRNVRAETLPPASFETITLRAVERFESILPIAARLVAPGGRLALLIGASQFEAARRTLQTFDWLNPIPVPLSASRILAIALVRPNP